MKLIQGSVNKVIYDGNGEATEFFYPFVITKHTDVKVMTVSPEGAETVLTNNYYVDEERSTVVYPGWVAGEEPGNQGSFAPLADGWKLVIFRQADYTQEIGLLEQYPYKTIENMVDKQTILIQQLKDATDRAMTVSVSVDNTDINMVIPHGKGTSFRWSDDGKRLEVTEDPAKVKVAVDNVASVVQQNRIKAEECARIATTKANEANASAESASAFASSASASEKNAKTSEDAAKSCMDRANEYMEKTEEYMDSAAAFAESAKTSETNAKNSETIARTNATSANNSANNARQSELTVKALAESLTGGDVLGIAFGGTGATTAAQARENLGVRAKTEVIEIAKGGTGATTAAQARTNLGINILGLVPTGTIIAYAANSAPDGYLLCNGAGVSRTTYATLFGKIGTTYGIGDGSTSFTLPNLTDKFLQGSATAGTAKAAGLPNITGTMWDIMSTVATGMGNGSGAFQTRAGVAGDHNSSTGTRHSEDNDGMTFDASRSSSIYGKSTTVQPPALTTRFYIKY